MVNKHLNLFVRDVSADVITPIHFESWENATESIEDLVNVSKEEGIMDKVC